MTYFVGTVMQVLLWFCAAHTHTYTHMHTDWSENRKGEIKIIKIKPISWPATELREI